VIITHFIYYASHNKHQTKREIERAREHYIWWWRM